ncbi:MAG: hypothetical protein JRC86_03250 [Deltaproteobacteria bacterium]|nr:hypothetical protein [Deltaproteobacteria bacterium]
MIDLGFPCLCHDVHACIFNNVGAVFTNLFFVIFLEEPAIGLVEMNVSRQQHVSILILKYRLSHLSRNIFIIAVCAITKLLEEMNQPYTPAHKNPGLKIAISNARE